MKQPSVKDEGQQQFPTEDDLGRMIRWSLEDSFSGEEPPDDIWPKILSQVQEMRTPTGPIPAKRRPAFSLVPLVQTVVVSALLLAFGLGVDRNLTAPRGGQAAHSTPVMQSMVTSQELPNDMMSGYLLAQLERQPITRPRLGGARP